MSASDSRQLTIIEGTAVPVPGQDIDTDRIIPARFLRCVTFDGLGEHAFEDDRKQLTAQGKTHPFDDARFKGASVLVVNSNFGCGSSREHAPQAIRRRGIRAVLGQSFSEIFFGNSVALGMPCPTTSRAALDALMAAVESDPSTVVTIDLHAMRANAAGQSYEIALPAATREAFLDGSWDATGLLLENFDDVRAVASRLPYVRGAW